MSCLQTGPDSNPLSIDRDTGFEQARRLPRKVNRSRKVACRYIQKARLVVSFRLMRLSIIIPVVCFAGPGLCQASAQTKVAPDAATYFEQARTNFNAGHFESALTNLNGALALSPEYAEAYSARGWVKLELHDCAGAIADDDHAIALRPQVAGFYGNRGRAKFVCGLTQEALVDYNRALELDPRCAEALYNRGILQFTRLTNYAAARDDFAKAIQLHSDPQEADIYYWRGCAEHKLRDYPRAIADYKQAIELNPNGKFASPAREALITAQKETKNLKK